MKKPHKFYLKLLGIGLVLLAAGGGLYSVESLGLLGIIVIGAGLLVLAVAQIYWYVAV